MQEHQHSEGQQEETLEKKIEQLKNWLEHFARIYKFATFNKERCEELMRRKSVKRLTPAKTARMVRRLVAANKEIEQASDALDRVSHELSQLGVEVSVESRSARAA
jgi:hypothetical protein